MTKEMKTRFAATVLMAFACVSTGAHADTGTVYWGGELGLARGDDQTGMFTNTLMRQYGGTATAKQDVSSSATVRLLMGYRWTEHIDLEGAYMQSPRTDLSFSGVAGNTMPYTGSADVRYSGFEYAVNWRPFMSPDWHGLYFRVGGHSSKIETNVLVRYLASTSSTISGTGIVYGVGYDQPLGALGKMRYAATQYDRIGGVSGVGGTVYSIGFIQDF